MINVPLRCCMAGATFVASACSFSLRPHTQPFASAGTANGYLTVFNAVPSSISDGVVPHLLEALREEPQNATRLAGYVERIEEGTEETLDDAAPVDEEGGNSSRFAPLIGLYDVSFVRTVREGDNPVGGKWTRKDGLAQKLLRTRRSFQHVLPVNSTGLGSTAATVAAPGGDRPVVGEVVNVVSLDALWGLLRTTIILRGDAVPLNQTERVTGTVQPLSSLAVRALFDAPRIVLGRTGRLLNINVGPRSSVVLDSPYVDDKIRLGLGGISGTRFVFERCPEKDDEANEFRALLAKKPWSKFKTLTGLSALTGMGLYGAYARGARVLGISFSIACALVGALIAFSGGGIERVDRSVRQARIYQQKQT
jgi:hypothetical protein